MLARVWWPALVLPVIASLACGDLEEQWTAVESTVVLDSLVSTDEAAASVMIEGNTVLVSERMGFGQGGFRLSSKAMLRGPETDGTVLIVVSARSPDFGLDVNVVYAYTSSAMHVPVSRARVITALEVDGVRIRTVDHGVVDFE